MKSLKVLALVGLTMTLVSCGNDSKSSKRAPEMNPVCDGIECLSSVTWKINLQGQDFPRKARVEINGASVLDECMGKQEYSIDRDSTPQSLTLENFTVPRAGDVKIHIVDQGWDCSDERTFISNDNVPFEVERGVAGSRVIINL